MEKFLESTVHPAPPPSPPLPPHPHYHPMPQLIHCWHLYSHILHDVSGYLRQVVGWGRQDTLETRNPIFFTLGVAVFSTERIASVLNWTVWTVMSWHIHVSKHYKLSSPYIWPSAWLLLLKCSLHSVPYGFKAWISYVHLEGKQYNIILYMEATGTGLQLRSQM